jgi:WD40 repeat protein
MIWLWKAVAGKEFLRFKSQDGKITSLAWSPDSRMLASGHLDGTVRLWEAETGRLRRTFSGGSEEIPCVTFSPDGRRLASSSADSTCLIWDVFGMQGAE